MADKNVYTPAFSLGLFVVIALPGVGLWRGGLAQAYIHDGLLVAAFLALLYAIHKEPVPEIGRRRLIMLAAGSAAMSIFIG